jgi:N-acetylmuramoyl-L-alanine amidase
VLAPWTRILLVALFLPALGAVLLEAAPPKTAPVRPAASSTVKIGGVDYVDVSEFGRRFGLKAAWMKPGERLVLKNETQRVELAVDSRESQVNGLRVMLSDPVRRHKKSLRVSRIDAERFLAPILQPGHGQSTIPPLKVIALDPGHGGKDSGKVNERLKAYEKTFALDLAVRLKKLLEAQGYRVIMTRTEDKFVEIADRPEIARRAGADLFLSLHFNSAPVAVTGVEVFSMTPQYQFSTDDPSRTDLAGSRVFNPGNASDHWNTVLGYKIHRALLRELKVPDRGHKRQRWGVLRLASCPAVLIEGGYLSNDGETKKIASPAYRQQMAEAIADGVRAYAAELAAARKK